MNLPVHSWYGEDYRCNLYQTENKFECDIVDNRKNEPKRFPIPPLPGTSLNKQLEFLQTYFQCFRKKDNGLILNICENVYSKEIDDYQITLYKVEESLIWKIFNRVTGQRKEQFLEDTLVYNHCLNGYDRYCGERLAVTSNNEVISYIKDSEIEARFFPEIRLRNCPILIWDVGNYWISLLQLNRQFKIEAHGLGTQREFKDIELKETSEKTIEHYRGMHCDVEIDRIQGILKSHIFFPSYESHKWVYDKMDIYLLRNNNDLVWKIVDKITGIKSLIPINSTYIYNVGQHKYYHRNLFYKFAKKAEKFEASDKKNFYKNFGFKNWQSHHFHISDQFCKKYFEEIKNLISYFKGCKIIIENFEKTTEGRIKKIYVERHITTSHLDMNKIIDSDQWAVTLINGGISSKGDTSFGHAAIVIEGVKELKYIRYFTDFRMLHNDENRGRVRLKTSRRCIH